MRFTLPEQVLAALERLQRARVDEIWTVLLVLVALFVALLIATGMGYLPH